MSSCRLSFFTSKTIFFQPTHSAFRKRLRRQNVPVLLPYQTMQCKTVNSTNRCLGEYMERSHKTQRIGQVSLLETLESEERGDQVKRWTVKKTEKYVINNKRQKEGRKRERTLGVRRLRVQWSARQRNRETSPVHAKNNKDNKNAKFWRRNLPHNVLEARFSDGMMR